VRIGGQRGIYRLRWWHEIDGPTVGRAEPVHLRGDAASALAFARGFLDEAAKIVAIRALLARELEQLHRLDDSEVTQELATRLAAGRIIAEHLPTPRLYALDGDVEDAEAPIAAPIERRDPKTWIEIELVDMEGNPVPNERYWIELPDGRVHEGRLDAEGRAYFGELDPGECNVRFPDLDGEAVASPGDPPLAKWKRQARARERPTWIEIELVGMDGSPIPDEAYRLALPTGEVREGRLDEDGRARVEGIDPGTCRVTFPALDEEAWEPV